MFQNIHVAVFPITESDRQTSYVRKVYQLLNSYGAKVIDLNVSGSDCKVIIEISEENLTEFIYGECISQNCLKSLAE